MAETESGDESRQTFQVAYYGDDPNDHSLDVEALAPALAAFSRLVRESNVTLNGDKARIRVLVASDFEHKCFNINFEVVQIAFQKVKSFLQDDHVKTAKELLQTIGVIRSSGAGSLLDYLKWKKDHAVAKVEPAPAPAPVKDASSPSLLTIQIIGGQGNTINITPEVLKLAENPRVLGAVKETFTPIEMKEATRIEFKENEQPVASISQSDVRDIVKAADVLEAPDIPQAVQKPSPETIVATLYVYSPVFDPKARRWRFVYKRNKHIYADISATSIAADAMKRGGSFVNDRYRVRMEVTPPDTDDAEPHFKIIQVLEFTPAPQQENLALPKPRKKRISKSGAKKRK